MSNVLERLVSGCFVNIQGEHCIRYIYIRRKILKEILNNLKLILSLKNTLFLPQKVFPVKLFVPLKFSFNSASVFVAFLIGIVQKCQSWKVSKIKHETFPSLLGNQFPNMKCFVQVVSRNTKDYSSVWLVFFLSIFIWDLDFGP